MRNGERLSLLVFVCLFSAAAWGQSLDLSISPTHYNQFDVENFITLRGAQLGTDSKKLGVHKTFMAKLADELNNGIGNLVDADVATESARLQALQTKQQLGIQALSIANQAPTVLLSLFR